MRQKFIAHKQLVIFSNLLPLGIVMLEMLALFIVSFKRSIKIGWGWFGILAQFLIIWLIMFIIYHNAYRVILIDEKGIKTGRTRINWEEIQRYKTVPIKLSIRFYLPKIAFKPMLYIYDCRGRKIRFALDKEILEKILIMSKDKSSIISQLKVNKT